MAEPGRSSTYRPDIDGLRAIAVLPVVAFHFGLPWFRGGFAGVSVFFVISGYLMAARVGRELTERAFSFAAYYERRARRILPALFAVLAFATVGATVLAPPQLFVDFGEALVGSVWFSSNLVFWRVTLGYFGPPSEWNPLLHTWSLGVEEQFYLVFPLFLAGVFRLSRSRRIAALLFIGASSLALSAWGTAHAPTATFYLLPLRGWELLTGVFVAMLPAGRPRPRGRSALALAGIALVVGSFVWLDPNRPFPGIYALPSCIGTALLLRTGEHAAPSVARWLAKGPLVLVGKLSYSLYLWHWPLFVFVERYLWARPLGLAPKLGLFVASLALAWLSFRFVEEPVRATRVLRGRARFAIATLASMAVLTAAGMVARSRDGWPSRLPGFSAVSMEAQWEAEAKETDWDAFRQASCFASDAGTRCWLSSDGRERAMLWGDSFASSYAYGLFRSSSGRVDVLEYTSPACPPILGFEPLARPKCAGWNHAMLDVARSERVSTVILAANWIAYLRSDKIRYEDVRRTITSLERAGLRVILVGQSPVFDFAYPDEYYYRRFGSVRAAGPRWAPADAATAERARLRDMAPERGFFDPMAPLCRETNRGTECSFEDDGRYLFRDYGHFTELGSTIVARALLEAISPAAQTPTSASADPADGGR